MELKIGSVIFDWKRTLYDPDLKMLIESSESIIKYFFDLNINLFLIGKGGREMEMEVENLGVSKYFSGILFVNESKKKEDFLSMINDVNRDQILVVGDRLKSEIQIGNSIGAITVWIRKGKFSKETPEITGIIPNYTVESLKDLFIKIQTISR